MPPFVLVEGVEPSICRLQVWGVPRYHVATINHYFNGKNTFFLISKIKYFF